MDKTDQDLPLKARKQKHKGKITTYPEKEIEDLYYVGSGNGWDTAKIARDAVTDALLRVADRLRRPAAG